MNENRTEVEGINLLPVGFIYFGLFSIAIWVDIEKRLFQFPKLGVRFWEVMGVDLLLGVAVGLAISGLTMLAVQYVKSFQELSGQFQKMIGPLGHKEIFFLSAFSAVGEEFFFRGLIQGMFGVVVASIIFGLLHIGPNRRFLPWTIFAIVVGFVMGGLYQWRGNLLVPVITHFTVNYVNLMQIGKQKEKSKS